MSVLPSLNNILGPFLLGLVFSSILYGVICLQVYSYFTRHSQRDRPFQKFFVVMLLILETLQLIFLIHGYYVVGVTNFGNLVADITSTPWSLRIQILFGVVVATATQQFYAWRIYHYSKQEQDLPLIVILVLTLSELAFAIVFVVQCYQYPDYYEAPISTPITVAGLSLEVACDVIITSGMVYYLLTRKSNIQRSSTPPTTILAVYCINSGLLSLVFATICLVTAICYPLTLIYAPFWFILVRLYSCSFMAMLNSRDHLRTAFQVEPGWPTVSVSVTTHTSYPGTNSSSDAEHRVDDPSRFPRRANTIRFAEGGELSLDMLESAAEKHEDKFVITVEPSDR